MKVSKLQLIAYISAAFFALACIYFLMGGKNISTPVIQTATSTSSVATITPIIRMESFTYATSSIQLSVEYAQFSHISSSDVEHTINTILKKEAQKVYDEQLKELKLSVSPESLPGQSEAEVFFQRKLLKDKIYVNPDTHILSIPYSNYIDTGGAHGTSFFTSQTFDTVTGRRLELWDVLEGEYEDIIQVEIKRQIQLGKDTESCVRCFPELSEQEGIPVFVSKNFLLSEKGIVFLYGAYDLGAYAITSAGQEILVEKKYIEKNISKMW